MALTRSTSEPSTASLASGQSQFSSVQELMTYLVDSNVPVRFYGSCPTMFKDLFTDVPPKPITAQQAQREAARLANECQKLAEQAASEIPPLGHMISPSANRSVTLATIEETNANQTEDLEGSNMNQESSRKNDPNCNGHDTQMEHQSEDALQAADCDLANQAPPLRTPERPDSLNLLPWEDEDGRLSWSSDSTITPAARFFYHHYGAHFSPDETLV